MIPFPKKKYGLILSDVPWKYEHASPVDDIEKRYPTLSTEELCRLPVKDIAEKDCVLFFWTTSPKIPEACRIIKAWGFNYRTEMIWRKDYIGPGYYARQRHESIFIATRGKPGCPLPEVRPDSVQYAARERDDNGALIHSRKQEIFRCLIEQMYPLKSKIELFARREFPGWDRWGDEVEVSK